MLIEMPLEEAAPIEMPVAEEKPQAAKGGKTKAHRREKK